MLQNEEYNTFYLCLVELFALVQLLDETIKVTRRGSHCSRLIHNLNWKAVFSLSEITKWQLGKAVLVITLTSF